MHGQIEIMELHQSWKQPPFKHWWKLYDNVTKVTYDFYFVNDEPGLVVFNGKAIWVSPTKKETLNFETFEIYHVSSKP